jgi:hypothetical protein
MLLVSSLHRSPTLSWCIGLLTLGFSWFLAAVGSLTLLEVCSLQAFPHLWFAISSTNAAYIPKRHKVENKYLWLDHNVWSTTLGCFLLELEKQYSMKLQGFESHFFSISDIYWWSIFPLQNSTIRKTLHFNALECISPSSKAFNAGLYIIVTREASNTFYRLDPTPRDWFGVGSQHQ